MTPYRLWPIHFLLAWLCILPFAQAQDLDRISGVQNRPLPQSRLPAADVDLPFATEDLLRSPQVVLPLPPASMRNDLMQRAQETRNAPGVPMRVGTERSIEQTGTPDRLRAVSPPVLQANGSYRVTLNCISSMSKYSTSFTFSYIENFVCVQSCPFVNIKIVHYNFHKSPQP